MFKIVLCFVKKNLRDRDVPETCGRSGFTTDVGVGIARYLCNNSQLFDMPKTVDDLLSETTI